MTLRLQIQKGKDLLAWEKKKLFYFSMQKQYAERTACENYMNLKLPLPNYQNPLYFKES